MKRVFHLSNCGTCQKIIQDHQLKEQGFEFQDIKSEPITAAQIDAMKKMSGSFESLFSRRAIKYKSLGLKDRKLTEKDYRSFILEEYTFLKRPVIIDGNQIFVGSDPKNLKSLGVYLEK
jgi:arsenate reductase (glutaredoxin)